MSNLATENQIVREKQICVSMTIAKLEHIIRALTSISNEPFYYTLKESTDSCIRSAMLTNWPNTIGDVINILKIYLYIQAFCHTHGCKYLSDTKHIIIFNFCRTMEKYYQTSEPDIKADLSTESNAATRIEDEILKLIP